LAADRPANTWPANTTMVPRPALDPLAATVTASRRFRGPSHPSSLDVRIAPVIATGTRRSRVRSSR
jgi:hypothetical protein